MIRLLVLRLVREGVVGNDRIMYMQLRHTESFPAQNFPAVISRLSSSNYASCRRLGTTRGLSAVASNDNRCSLQPSW
jgi:hypothetical protein